MHKRKSASLIPIRTKKFENFWTVREMVQQQRYAAVQPNNNIPNYDLPKNTIPKIGYPSWELRKSYVTFISQISKDAAKIKKPGPTDYETKLDKLDNQGLIKH